MNERRDHAQMIHVVGLYKCGTSWLRDILAAHPQVVAWREFDVLSAVYRPDYRLHRLPGIARDYLWRRGEDAAWRRRREALVVRNRAEVYREMFLGRGWIPLLGEELQQQALELDALEPEAALDSLLALGKLRLRPTDAPPLHAERMTRAVGIQSFRRGSLLALMRRVRAIEDPSQVPALFFESLLDEVADDTTTVCKAADQVMRLGHLQRVSSGSRCLAIIRDGRDAAISAQHFEQLMRKLEAPWRVAQTSRIRRLMGWGVRAAKLAAHVRRGEVLVVRYEDLKQNFAGTLAALLEHLRLAADRDLLTQIETASDFRRVSGGRRAGESAAHIARRGIVGEWREVFTPAAAALAWRLLGRELEAFGYSADGVLRPSPLVIGPVRGG